MKTPKLKAGVDVVVFSQSSNYNGMTGTILNKKKLKYLSEDRFCLFEVKLHQKNRSGNDIQTYFASRELKVLSEE